ncbi:MAG: hypothetical protein VYA34_06800 [Myxococcota bacterium]|nr:hypothetical protein [Myxococcota bacterium]
MDVEECSEYKNVGSEYADWLDIVEGRVCACKGGFVGDGGGCLSEQCLDGRCGTHDAYLPTPGGNSYFCACVPAFRVEGGVCVRVDECVDPDLNRCRVNQKCVSLENGYR